jgi:hypothetical protein
MKAGYECKNARLKHVIYLCCSGVRPDVTYGHPTPMSHRSSLRETSFPPNMALSLPTCTAAEHMMFKSTSTYRW